jgi:hypothetical protein
VTVPEMLAVSLASIEVQKIKVNRNTKRPTHPRIADIRIPLAMVRSVPLSRNDERREKQREKTSVVPPSEKGNRF